MVGSTVGKFGTVNTVGDNTWLTHLSIISILSSNLIRKSHHRTHTSNLIDTNGVFCANIIYRAVQKPFRPLTGKLTVSQPRQTGHISYRPYSSNSTASCENPITQANGPPPPTSIAREEIYYLCSSSKRNHQTLNIKKKNSHKCGICNFGRTLRMYDTSIIQMRANY